MPQNTHTIFSCVDVSQYPDGSLQALSPENYRDHVQEALDILHASVPRALVNLVLYFDVSPLTNISTGIICDAIHP